MALTPEKIALAKRFASARASAGVVFLGPDQHFRSAWRPRLAGRFVRNGLGSDTFDERSDAINAARRYRERCREVLADRKG